MIDASTFFLAVSVACICAAVLFERELRRWAWPVEYRLLLAWCRLLNVWLGFVLWLADQERAARRWWRRRTGQYDPTEPARFAVTPGGIVRDRSPGGTV